MSNDNYPRWKYHADKPAVIVNNEDEEKDLGRGWKDEPVKGNAEVDLSVQQHADEERYAEPTGDEVFDTFLADNGMDKVPAKYQAMIRTAYDHSAPVVGGAPVVEYGHIVGPQDEVVMVDSEEARKALLKQAKDLGLTVHHASSSKTIQAAIDAHTAVKSSTPAAAKALPKDTDVTNDKE